MPDPQFHSVLISLLLPAQQQTQQHLQNQQQLVQQAAAQLGTNPQAHLVQQAIVQQSINSAPWQQAQQQAQQQVMWDGENEMCETCLWSILLLFWQLIFFFLKGLATFLSVWYLRVSVPYYKNVKFFRISFFLFVFSYCSLLTRAFQNHLWKLCNDYSR